MRACDGLDNRLFRHDRQIAINTARANFTGWHDRLIAGTVLFIALAVVRAWFSDQPWKIAAWAALGAGIIAGMGASRLLTVRIGYHSADGLLAADAAQPSLRLRYMVAWHGIGMTTLAAVTLIARPSLLIISVPAYLTGVFVAGVIGRLATKRMVGKTAVGWTVRRWLHRPGAGVVTAMILLLSLLPARTLETKGLLAVVGMEAILFAALLTTVDQNIVRFKAGSGHRPWRIVIGDSYGLLLFAAITVPVCRLTLGPVPAGIILAASAAMLLLMAMRVFAYCVHGKRFADLLISILAGLLMLVTYSMIILLPVLALVVLWQLQRRAAAKTWLLA